MKGKFGIFFEKQLISISNMINYCEKEKIRIDKFRSESVNGITKKYDWEYVCKKYLEIFKSLV